MTADNHAGLLARLATVPDQFRAMPPSLTMSGHVIYASTARFIPHPVAIEAIAAIESLQAQLAKWDERERNLHLVSLTQIVDERDQLRAELARVSKDAERYQWLRFRIIDTRIDGHVTYYSSALALMPFSYVRNGNELDSRIDHILEDAALAGKGYGEKHE